MTRPFLILGNGQIGSALSAACGDCAVALGREQLDLSDPAFIARLEHALQVHAPRAVINTCAYTNVDKAEGEGAAEAWRVNAEAAGELALACQRHRLPLVHYSSDYVFDGSGSTPWREEDEAKPLNLYGKSKLAGEKRIAAAGGDHLMFRTSWVYNATAKNFFTTMLRLFGEKQSLRVINDQIGAPTYAAHLATASIQALNHALDAPIFPSGLYHVCAGGQTSWHGFAQAIFALATSGDYRLNSPIICQTIEPIPSLDYPLPARRPHNSRLNCAKANDVLKVRLPAWQTGLTECVESNYASAALHNTGFETHPA